MKTKKHTSTPKSRAIKPNRARYHLSAAAAAAALMCAAIPGHAASITISQTPLYLTTNVKPNVMVIYDNSQSMDATMSGMIINGDEATTRGNIARNSLRSVITNYRSSFNWGLSAFNTSTVTKFNTHAYYFGSDSEVLFTNDCVGGISASNGGLRCVANPQNNNGYTHITYKSSGDDPEVNDILYSTLTHQYMWGIGVPPVSVTPSTSYNVCLSHAASTNWNFPSSFSSCYGTPWNFYETDAGFLPTTPPNRRQFWIKRGWGYYADITGEGVIHRQVAADSSTHYSALMSKLATETSTTSSTEIKNAAVATPIAGALKTTKDYFAGASSPITQSCQKNFVLLATDGNPTGKLSGAMYSDAERAVTYDAASGTWNFGTAYQDVFTQVDALRNVSFGGNAYDIKTFVIGMGSTVNNPGSIAALNQYAQRGGTVSAYLGSNQADLLTAFSSVASSILQQTSAASAVAVNSGSWNSGSELYQGRFSSMDWSGQLLSYDIAADGSIATSPSWDAGAVLNTLNWNSGRKIFTYKPGAALGSRGVAFRWPATPASPTATEISSNMVSLLNATSAGVADGNGSQRLEYLRGNAALELRNCTACPLSFRNRATSVLGDIINSAPYYVHGPQNAYRNNVEIKRYSVYGATRLSQTPIIYVGANDGMLHAFNATTGAEVFAYVPWGIRSKLSELTEKTYTHKYTVDGSPVVGDVYYDNDWHSILVSSFGLGAKGLFALDVTNVDSLTEPTGGGLARWEIDETDNDVGVINSKPAIVKMRDGSYRAIIANGYNSANGNAVLLLIDIKTGAITKIDTGAGDPTNKNGLSGVAAVSITNNGIVDYVYAGDLYGNVWKFDLSSSNPALWGSAYTSGSTPIPLFTTASSRPITARVDVTMTPAGHYMVSFGTGQYLETADVTSTGTQSLYGIIDKGTPVAFTSLQSQTITGTAVSGSETYRQSTNAVGVAKDGTTGPGDNVITLANYNATKSGWYMNLTAGERVVSESSIRFGRASFSTAIPSSASCSYGGTGWIMEVDALTGNRSLAFDVSKNGAINSSDYLGGKSPVGYKINAIPSAATTIGTGGHGVDVKIVNTTSGDLVGILEQGVTRNSERTSWEQIK